VQVPVQQLASTAHASPGWPQKEEGWHVPFAHRAEQQSALAEHWLPSVLHCALSCPHVPLVQAWLQHWPLEVQG
jgi:hypothetical protein